MLVDPTGMWADGYTIFDNGDIEKTSEEGGDDYDVLYNEDKSDKIVIGDTDIMPGLERSDSEVGDFNSAITEDNIGGLFEFCANNSDDEWSLQQYSSSGEIKYQLSTYHNPEAAPSPEGLGISDDAMISSFHSHPGKQYTNERSELYSMGKLPGTVAGNITTDYEKAHERWNRNGGNEPFKAYVYFPGKSYSKTGINCCNIATKCLYSASGQCIERDLCAVA